MFVFLCVYAAVMFLLTVTLLIIEIVNASVNQVANLTGFFFGCLTLTASIVTLHLIWLVSGNPRNSSNDAKNVEKQCHFSALFSMSVTTAILGSLWAFFVTSNWEIRFGNGITSEERVAVARAFFVYISTAINFTLAVLLVQRGVARWNIPLLRPSASVSPPPSFSASNSQ